jgi:hypothetical protein
MGPRGRLWLVWIMLLVTAGCATGLAESTGKVSGAVGMYETDLIAAKGQPQQVIPTPEGGKILVYETSRMDQVAVMGSGAWGKPEQVYYWLNPQGQVEKTKYYPFGKKKFLFPSGDEPAAVATAAAPPAAAPAPPLAPAPTAAPAPEAPPAAAASAVPTPKPLPAASPAPPPPAPAVSAPRPPAPKPAEPPLARPAPPAAPAKSMGEAAGLELRMSKAEVTKLLGLPDQTEGFYAGDKAVTIWTYKLMDPKGQRLPLPVVFENGRLTGWGETYSQMIRKKGTSPSP